MLRTPHINNEQAQDQDLQNPREEKKNDFLFQDLHNPQSSNTPMYCACGKMVRESNYTKHIESEYHFNHFNRQTDIKAIVKLDHKWNTFMQSYEQWLYEVDELSTQHHTFDMFVWKMYLEKNPNITESDFIYTMPSMMYRSLDLDRFLCYFYRVVAKKIYEKITNDKIKIVRDRKNKKKNAIKLLCLNRELEKSYYAEPEILKMIMRY